MVGTAARPPLRERKKAATRAAIQAHAERLFAERGYDAVTVAEIADAADVAVKTVFVYFRSKEDLAFTDTSLRDALVAAVRDRPPGTTAARAVGTVLHDALDDPAADGPDGFHRAYGGSAALQSRLLRMWTEYEDALAAVLVGTTPTPAVRLAAIALVGVVRSFTTPEVRRLADAAGSADERAAALHAWVDAAVAQVESVATAT